MSSTRIEISCPHCLRIYRLRVDLRTLAGTRSTARCGRCGRRFSLTKRVHDSGVMTAPLTPPAREIAPRTPLAGEIARAALPRRAERAPGRDTDPTPPPAEVRRDPAEADARRRAPTPPEPPRRPPVVAPRDYASEPPRESQPLHALRRATQPQMMEVGRHPTQPSLAVPFSLEDAFADDDGWREEALVDAADRLRVASPPQGTTVPDPLGSVVPLGTISAGEAPSHAATAPVGDDAAEDGSIAPLDAPFGSDEITPVPSEASVSEWALDPDAWVARADPGLDALSAARSEAAVALRWLLLEDRPTR